jgi:hypothetical protein
VYLAKSRAALLEQFVGGAVFLPSVVGHIFSISAGGEDRSRQILFNLAAVALPQLHAQRANIVISSPTTVARDEPAITEWPRPSARQLLCHTASRAYPSP